jgi:hypothetical protein
VSNNTDVAMMKSRFDIREEVQDISPRLIDIWGHINSLKFEDDPDYAFISGVLDEICVTNRISEDDPNDWADFVE